MADSGYGRGNISHASVHQLHTGRACCCLPLALMPALELLSLDVMGAC